MKYEHIWDIERGQDGAIYGDYLFRFDSAGFGNVYSMSGQNYISSFVLDHIDILKPHSNSVCFGTEFYNETDEFPLLYSNIYNNYAKEEDRLEGVCCVYRITREEKKFTSRLVQVIKIGFVDDLDYWKSLSGNGDVRPYGNFVVDTDHNKLYAFTMRDSNKTTRYFEFDLPKVADGISCDVCGANVVTLQIADIKSYFDCEYSNYIQGACYHDNMIYSVEGFSNQDNRPKLQVIDLVKKEQFAAFDLYGIGLDIEPEFVSFYNDQLYYSDAKGSVYRFEFE